MNPAAPHRRTLVAKALAMTTVSLIASGHCAPLALAKQTPSINASAKKPAQVNFKKEYQGTIGKYPVSMIISVSGKNITGSYSYDRVGKPIKLKGALRRISIFQRMNDNATMKEFDGKGKVTGNFSGVLTDFEYVGTWSMGNKKLDFSLIAKDSKGSDSATISRKQHARYKSEYNEGVVVYPVIKLQNAALTEKLQKELEFEKVFGPDLKGWLNKSKFYVDYNKDNILDIVFWIDGSGAYPDSYYKVKKFNLKSGAPLLARDLFKNDQINSLMRLVEKAMQNSIRSKINQESDKETIAFMKDELKDAHFTIKEIDQFSIGAGGITFLYEFGFPHVSKAAEPNGAFFFSFDQLRQYLKPGLFAK